MAFSATPCLGIHPRRDQHGVRRFVLFCGLWCLAKALRAGRVPGPFGAGIPINTKRPEHDLGPFIHSIIEPQILFVGAHPRRTFVRKGRQSRARFGLCVHDASQDRFGVGAVHGRHVLDMTNP